MRVQLCERACMSERYARVRASGAWAAVGGGRGECVCA